MILQVCFILTFLGPYLKITDSSRLEYDANFQHQRLVKRQVSGTQKFILSSYPEPDQTQEPITTTLESLTEPTTTTLEYLTEPTTTEQKVTTKQATLKNVCQTPFLFFENIGDEKGLIGGENLTVTCLGCADLCWSYDSNNTKVKIIKNSDTFGNFQASLSLSINNVTYDDRGTYKCGYCNSASNEEVEFYLNVTKPFKPVVLSNKTVESASVNVPSTLLLNCSIEAVPPPKITWFKNSRPLEVLPPRVTVSKEGKLLTILDTENEDVGFYECKASNYLGQAIQSHNVILYDKRWQTWYPLIVAFAIVLVIVFCILMYYRRRCNKRIEEGLRHIGLVSFDKGVRGLFNPKLGMNEQVDILPYEKQWEFSRRDINLGKQIGSGAFGVVLKAIAKNIIEGETYSTVAVKMCKRDTDAAYMKALVSELKIMIHIGKHVNIVNLLGACTRNVIKQDLLVIVEYCRYGNLRDFIIKHRKKFNNQINAATQAIDFSIKTPLPPDSESSGQDHDESGSESTERYVTRNAEEVESESSGFPHSTSSNSSDWSTEHAFRCNYKGDYRETIRVVSTKDLLVWSFQVARGMEYLAERKVLHGDLAARNILLADDNIVKICDFGLAKSIYNNPTYKRNGEEPLPIKWMAVESLCDEVFSSQSDVWSFGIVLWELFSMGQMPYPGMAADEVYKQVIAGYRMEAPEFSNNDIYSLMTDCWKREPSQRPEFGGLVKSIGHFLEDNEKNYYVKLNDPYLMINLKKGTDNLFKSDEAPDANGTNLSNGSTNQRESGHDNEAFEHATSIVNNENTPYLELKIIK